MFKLRHLLEVHYLPELDDEEEQLIVGEVEGMVVAWNRLHLNKSRMIMAEGVNDLIDDLPQYGLVQTAMPTIVSDYSLDGLQEEKQKLGEYVSFDIPCRVSKIIVYLTHCLFKYT